MAETYAYTSDGRARVVLSGWITSLFLYNSAGGKIYAERFVPRGGFIGLFQTMGWVAAGAQSLGVDVVFQGLLPGSQPALAVRGDGGPSREAAEVSYWAVGLGVKVDMVGGSIAPSGPILPNPSPTLGPASVDVRALRVRGRGTIDDQQLTCDEIVVGPFQYFR
jgi:hypothetical protein